MLHVTDCGLPGVTTIPYGIHMCHFYDTRAGLAAALVPYFAAGLNKRERCIWITAEPLSALDAAAELVRAGLNVNALLHSGSLLIRDHTDWYGRGSPKSAAEVVGVWMEEEKRALAAGYSGLRVTGNTSFLVAAKRAAFMDYEELLNQACPERRIVVLCSYLREQHTANGHVDEIVQRHSCTLERPDEGWRIVPARI